MSLSAIIKTIRKNKYFLITSHTNPEGDALGSEIALWVLLKKMGKRAIMVNYDGVPYEYEFLPFQKHITRFTHTLIGKFKFDCFVALDCSDLKRTGGVHMLNVQGKPVLNIDHHVSNQYFGDVNWVDSCASSASEMVFALYKRLGIAFTKDAALLLYVGICTDTGSFRYTNTTSSTHRMAAELLTHGFSAAQVYKKVYENIPFQDMKFLSQLLPHMRSSAQGKIVFFEIKRSLLKDRIFAFDVTEKILSFARAIKGVEVVILFRENVRTRGEIRINLRSQGKIDVNKIAAFFGGGGHKTASGATLQGRIVSVRKKVLRKIKESLSKK